MRKKLFKTNSIIKKYQNLIAQINNLEDNFKTLTDNELRAENLKLKTQYKSNPNLVGKYRIQFHHHY